MDCDELAFKRSNTLPLCRRSKQSGDVGSIRLILTDTTEINCRTSVAPVRFRGAFRFSHPPNQSLNIFTAQPLSVDFYPFL
ncbi:hypothetical protein HOV93_04090 [Planctomycetes bacterium FF15]|uniref:Uncharacterized protein n=1 Tax=Bremerella alba TaxID=980252 RepID=A0A7V8V1K3_9BACT|nr:hypothetical protein [Bremerella alba]